MVQQHRVSTTIRDGPQEARHSRAIPDSLLLHQGGTCVLFVRNSPCRRGIAMDRSHICTDKVAKKWLRALHTTPRAAADSEIV